MNVKPLHNTRSPSSTDNTSKAFEESPCKFDHDLLQESSKVTIGQICTQGLLCLNSLKDFISIFSKAQ